MKSRKNRQVRSVAAVLMSLLLAAAAMISAAALPEGGAWEPFNANASVETSDAGAAYINVNADANGMVFSKPVPIGELNLTASLRIPSILQAEQRHFHITLLTERAETLIQSLTPAQVSGVIIYFYTAVNGKTVAAVHVCKNGSATLSGGAEVVLSDEPIGPDTVIKLSFQKTAGGYRVVLNDTVTRDLGTALNGVFPEDTAYVTAGMTHEEDDSGEPRFVISDFTAEEADIPAPTTVPTTLGDADGEETPTAGRTTAPLVAGNETEGIDPLLIGLIVACAVAAVEAAVIVILVLRRRK